MSEITYLLFTTTTCPKCPAMKAWVAEHLLNIQGEILDNTAANFFETAQTFDITAAPLLLFLREGKEIFRTDDIGVAERYISEHLPA